MRLAPSEPSSSSDGSVEVYMMWAAQQADVS